MADRTKTPLVPRLIAKALSWRIVRAYLRNFVYRFAELLSDRLNRELVARAMTGHVNDYEL